MSTEPRNAWFEMADAWFEMADGRFKVAFAPILLNISVFGAKPIKNFASFLFYEQIKKIGKMFFSPDFSFEINFIY
jgi:hypothetical protein